MNADETRGFDPSVEAISARAYELYLRRGQESGHEIDDWIEAEEELRQAARSAIASWNPYLGYLGLVLDRLIDEATDDCHPASAGGVAFAAIVTVEANDGDPGLAREVVPEVEGRARRGARR